MYLCINFQFFSDKYFISGSITPLLDAPPGGGLCIPCEKMSLQWRYKVCNEILWMVLGEERGDPVRHEDELWKGSARI